MPECHQSVSDVQTQHIDTHQLAKRWCLSYKSIARLRQYGGGPHYLRIRGRVVYRLEDVVAYEQERVFAGVGRKLEEGGEGHHASHTL